MHIKSTLKLIPNEYRKRFIVISVLNILKNTIDLVGLASLLPIIIILLDNTIIQDNAFFNYLFKALPIQTNREFEIILCICILLWLPLKSVLSIVITKAKQKYLLGLYRYYANSIFKLYQNRGLLFIKQSHSSQLSVKINNACYSFALQVIGSIINLIGEIFIVLILFICALYASTTASLLLFFTTTPIIIIYFLITQKRIKELGTKSFEAKKEQVAIVQDSLRGFINITISGSKQRVLDKFNKGLKNISDSDINYTIYSQIPTLILQIMVAIALISLLFISDFVATSTTLFILFGFIAVRLMPAIIRISNYWIFLNKSSHFYDTIKEINTKENVEQEQDTSPIIFKDEINLKNISFTFPDGAELIKNISLTIKKGEIVGFTGRSGVGKSTLFNIILGLYQANKGQIFVDNTPLDRKNIAEWHKMVGYSEQDTFISRDTLAHNIAMTDSPDTELVNKYIDKVGLQDIVASMPNGIFTQMSEMGTNLSGGEKQRIGIARALYKNAQVLLFDETTSALDSKNEENIISLLSHLAKRDKLTVLIISHRESTLRLCNRVIQMQ